MLRVWSLVLGLMPLSAFAADYQVGPGDSLSVLVYDEPTLSADVVVSETCTITLALIGRVEACGHSTAELEANIAGQYAAGYLVNPNVAVKVARYHSQRVDVLGEVQKRGPLYLEGQTSLVEVVSLAGGPTADNVVTVEVVSEDGSSHIYDLRELTTSGQAVWVLPGDKVMLRPGELVYIEGQIKRPGVVTLNEGLTVTQALTLAGGSDEYANLRRVVLRHADGTKEIVNAFKAARGASADPVLKADDHVIVPRGAF